MKKLFSSLNSLGLGAHGLSFGGSGAARPLDRIDDFGSNPGALVAKIHIPATLLEKPALVVVLHGCTQTADDYNHGSGWSDLADHHGFALLFPEQQRANNPNLCFNWFSRADSARGRGEAHSIAQMIATMIEAHAIDPSRIFVTGLSAGGAMASIMLATYPELFAGGAIIAGLPFAAATSVSQALQVMRTPLLRDGAQWGDQIRAASAHQGPWPRVAIWHGTADATVSVANADAILAQWLSIHDLDDAAYSAEAVAGHRRRIWSDAHGRPVIEDYRIADMGHGTPLATKGEAPCGTVMPHMIEAGISSTRLIAQSWGLLAAGADARPRRSTVGPSRNSHALSADSAETWRIGPLHPTELSSHMPGGRSVQKHIENALRAAGLMR